MVPSIAMNHKELNQTSVICLHQIVQFLTIQFSLSFAYTQLIGPNSSIWPIDWTLSGAITLRKSGSVRNGNEGHSAFLKDLSLTIRLFSVISRHSFKESYPSTEMQSVYSTVPADRVSH